MPEATIRISGDVDAASYYATKCPIHWHANQTLQTTHPWSSEATYDWQLGWRDQVMIDRNAWIDIHQFFLHRFYIKHWMMFHVATTQLVLVWILLLTWHTYRVAQKVRTLSVWFSLAASQTCPESCTGTCLMLADVLKVSDVLHNILCHRFCHYQCA